MTSRKVVLHTDILLKHLCGGSPSALRRAMASHLCYVTVVQAAQLFGLAATRSERVAVGQLLSAVRILGLPAKIAPRCGMLLARGTLGVADALTASLCIESRLPLLTGAVRRFKDLPGLRVIPERRLRPARVGR